VISYKMIVAFRYGKCGGLLRPGTVWFGEVPEGQGEIVRNLTQVDVLLVIGTSSLVSEQSAYQLLFPDMSRSIPPPRMRKLSRRTGESSPSST
jgi:NAD-dependent SIR2 family protein deacetylase